MEAFLNSRDLMPGISTIEYYEPSKSTYGVQLNMNQKKRSGFGLKYF